MTAVRSFRHLILLSFRTVALLCLLGVARAQNTEEIEAKVKAGFLLNFARYVEWPSSSFVSSNSPIVIGILGQEGLGRAMDEICTGKTIDSHTVEVRRARRVSELANCHIVFIAASDRDRLRNALEMLKNKPVLTVSDFDGFTATRIMVVMRKRQQSMRFEINREIAEGAKLKISSKLLRLADNYRQ